MENLASRNNLVTRNEKFGIIKEENFTNSLTENTKRAYMVDIMQFVQHYFDVERLSDVTEAQIRSVDSSIARTYTNWLKTEANDGKGYSVATINRKLTSLSSFYSFLSRREIGIMDYNPFDTRQGAKRLRQNKRYSNTRCLTLEETQKMFAVLMNKELCLSTLRDRIIILLLATTGMRRDEVACQQIGNIIQTNGGYALEFIAKGEIERLVMLTNTIKTMIDKYLLARGLTYKDKEEYIFVGHSSNAHYYNNDHLTAQAIFDMVKDIAEEAGLDKSTISPHCFRHTYVTESLNLGIPIQDVADLVGHADISTTRRYAHTNNILTHNPAQAFEDKLFNLSTPC